MKLVVNIRRQSNGEYIADIPAIPSLEAAGSTPRQAQEHISHAIRQCLASMTTHCLQIRPVQYGGTGPDADIRRHARAFGSQQPGVCNKTGRRIPHFD